MCVCVCVCVREREREREREWRGERNGEKERDIKSMYVCIADRQEAWRYQVTA